MVRSIAVSLALAFAPPAFAQTAPPAPPPAGVPAPAKPAQKRPAPPKPGAAADPAGAAAPRGPCIGVIPYIGDQFSVQRVGVTMFGNELKQVPMSSWGLDEVV